MGIPQKNRFVKACRVRRGDGSGVSDLPSPRLGRVS